MMVSDLDRLRGLRILVVEDTFMLAEELSEFLGELGCETIGPAARACDAAELVVANALDGALLDVNLSRGRRPSRSPRTSPAARSPSCSSPATISTPPFPAEFRGVPRISKPLDLGVLVRTMLRHFPPPRPGRTEAALCRKARCSGTPFAHGPWHRPHPGPAAWPDRARQPGTTLAEVRSL